MKNINALLKRREELCEQHNKLLEQGGCPSKQMIQNLLIVYRMLAREITVLHNVRWFEYRRMKHQNERMERAGITFLPAVSRLELLKKQDDEALIGMAELGETLMQLLDKWQAAGASYDELLTFCNANYPGMREQLNDFYNGDSDSERDFSGLVFVHNLDYKNPRDTGCIEYEIDAPLTHCIKEYVTESILHNPEAKAVTCEAMAEAFPGIMDHATFMRTDEDGVRRFYDKDGECIGEALT